MKFKSLVLAVLAAVSGAGAHASSTNWGPHALLESSLGGSSGGVIADTYTFSLASASTIASSISVLGAPIVPASYSIFMVGGDGIVGTGDDTGLFSWTFGGSPVVHTVNLSAGNYYYSVFGMVNGSAVYSINSAATVSAPVPEPETYALFAAGLGIVGFVASRRRRDH